MSLEGDRLKYLPLDAHTVDGLDLLHVLTRLWEASHVFNPEGSEGASLFVRQPLPLTLKVLTADVVARLGRLGVEGRLRKTEATRLRGLCAFLENNLHPMNYDEYPKAGLPVSSSVIEGACRHVIRDRMRRGFRAFRIDGECSRLYPHRDATEKIPRPIAA